MQALRWLTTATTAALMVATARAAPVSSGLTTNEAQETPMPTWTAQKNCTRSPLEAGVLDCFYQGELVHVHTADNRTQVQAPGTVIWDDASTGDVEVRAPGFGLTCVTVKEGKKAGEQHCHIQSAWWNSDSAAATVPTPAAAADETIPTTTTTTKAPPPPTFSFLRGNNRALDVVVGPNGETETQTRVVGPLTDVVVDDCQPTEKGRHCTYVDGRWAHVATTDEGFTHVTAPGVEVRTAPKEGGDVSVDAWGFHIKCRKDAGTNKTKCHTTNDWFGNGGGGRGGGREVTPLPEVDEAVPVGGGVDDVPDPVMHLHPHPPQVEAPVIEEVMPAGSSSSTSTSTSTSTTSPALYNNNRGPSPGYRPPAPVVDPLPTDPVFSGPTTTTPTTPPANLVDPIFSIPIPVTGPSATTPPADLVDPGFSVPTTRTTPPADLVDPMFTVPATGPDATTDWEATTPLPDTLTPIAIVDPAPPTPAEIEMGQEAAMEEVDPPMFGFPRKEQLQDENKGTNVDTSSSPPSPATPSPKPSSPSPKPSSPPSPKPSVPDPRDPSWLSNSKNCTRAIKGEGKDCWVDGRWVHVRTGVANNDEGSTPTPAAAAAGGSTTTTTEVTVPRVVVLADDNTDIEEVVSAGVRVSCKRDVATGHDICTTTTALTSAKEGEEKEVEEGGKAVKQADDSTGLEEVVSPGVRISCKRDVATGHDICTTTTALTSAKEGEVEEGGK